MIHTKILLSLAAIALLSTGCTETEEKTTKTTVVETKPVVKPVAVVKEVVEVKKVEQKSEVTAPIIKAVQQKAKDLDVSILYKKCSACHGTNAEKKALNKSEIIKDWDATKIAEALKGYKAGTYGGAMKGLMISQVSQMDDKTIDLLSQHIADFK